MPLDMNLLYGMMASSGIAHAAIPFGISMAVNQLTWSHFNKLMLFLSICVALSFLCQFGLLTGLQAQTCRGVKDVSTISLGALIAAVITAAMLAVPAFIEPMRLVVSNIIEPHQSLQTAEGAQYEKILIAAAADMAKVGKDQSSTDATRSVSQKGGGLQADEYEVQTFQEITRGAMYWGAFAGAYGIGIGSLIASKCPAVN